MITINKDADFRAGTIKGALEREDGGSCLTSSSHGPVTSSAVVSMLQPTP